MTTQQGNIATKAKLASRRLFDGLFGHRAARKEEEQKDETLLLHTHAREADEQQAKLEFFNSLGCKAAAAAMSLEENLQALMRTDDADAQQNAIAALANDTKLLRALFGQFQKTDEQPQPTETTSKRPVMVAVFADSTAMRQLQDAVGTDYDVCPCSNGWQALAEVYRRETDIVVADAQMGVLDGQELLCNRLKANPQTCLIPVILVAATAEQRLRGLEQGADACLEQPLDASFVAATARNLISNRRQVQRNYELQRIAAQQQPATTEKRKSSTDRLMERVLGVINKHLNDAALNIDLIADEVGISRVHLHRKMKEKVGLTPHDFIRQLRLEQAARMLATSDKNITEVVYACGFTNAASFSTMFKSAYGLTPSEYMNEKRRAAQESSFSTT